MQLIRCVNFLVARFLEAGLHHSKGKEVFKFETPQCIWNLSWLIYSTKRVQSLYKRPFSFRCIMRHLIYRGTASLAWCLFRSELMPSCTIQHSGRRTVEVKLSYCCFIRISLFCNCRTAPMLAGSFSSSEKKPDDKTNCKKA